METLTHLPENPEAEIRYTVDGGVPGTGSSLYAEPFSLPSGAYRLRVYGRKAGLDDSPVVDTGSFTVSDS